MPIEFIIKSGSLVDGSGAPSRSADISISSGKIVDIHPDLHTYAGSVIDSSGLTVAPGFIDPHTHYDALICWDGATAPSSWHGVTTVVMGNCGVGIAPCRSKARELAMRDLVKMEAIPFEVQDLSPGGRDAGKDQRWLEVERGRKIAGSTAAALR